MGFLLAKEKNDLRIDLKYVRSRHALLKALTRPFLGFVINPKYEGRLKIVSF